MKNVLRSESSALLLRSATIRLGFTLVIILVSVFCGPVGLPPLAPNKPIGPIKLQVGRFYFFSTSAVDPDGNLVALRFNWGDGNTSDWGADVPSGQKDSASHTWTKAGTFELKAQAKDQRGNTSPWSSGLSVTVDTGADANFSEGFEQQSTWGHWWLSGALSHIGTDCAHTGSYSAILEDTGTRCYIGGSMALTESIDVRYYSSAEVSFWYKVLEIPNYFAVGIYASLTYLNNSGTWQTVKIFARSGSPSNWQKIDVDISPYCGIMRYAELSFNISANNQMEEWGEVKVAIDDILLTPNPY